MLVYRTVWYMGVVLVVYGVEHSTLFYLYTTCYIIHIRCHTPCATCHTLCTTCYTICNTQCTISHGLHLTLCYSIHTHKANYSRQSDWPLEGTYWSQVHVYAHVLALISALGSKTVYPCQDMDPRTCTSHVCIQDVHSPAERSAVVGMPPLGQAVFQVIIQYYFLENHCIYIFV